MPNGKFERAPEFPPSEQFEGQETKLEKAEGFTEKDWGLVGKVESTDFGTIFWEGVGGKSHDEITEIYKKGEQVFGEKKFEKMCLERGTEVLLDRLGGKLETGEGKEELADALGVVERLKLGSRKVGGGLAFERADIKKIEEMAQTTKGKGDLINAMVIYDAERQAFNRERKLERGELIKYIGEKRTKEAKEQ